ncbi:hypothetical protein HYN59_10925 [Flavobacterium album]|uniref:DUF4468 domain-containing protein n=1 Tax=Flavobacterium album TaxID=2175091 RepID=A0A2S1QZ17_9FLAO|nr:hypothetical protein [Flavobacterium album]AWH85589.1 hypothetical protein HYN59_10925 [Flavobacterium album]
MKNILSAILLLLTFYSTNANAQEAKDYTTLLKDLNKMLKSAEEFSWMYEPDFKIVSPYKVDKDGKLSVIIKGKIDDTEVTHKYEAPLEDIYDFVMDIYYVASFKSDSVIVSEFRDGKWVEIDKRNFFHLGKPKEQDAHHWSSKLRTDFNDLFPDLKNEFEWMD